MRSIWRHRLHYAAGIAAIGGLLGIGLDARPQATPQTSSTGAELSDEAERIQESAEVLRELTATADDAIPAHLLNRAEAIVVIPSLIKGGFIVGGKHGKGILSRRDRTTNTWSTPAFVKVSGGSIGWQIGVESIDLVLLVMNKGGLEQLLQDRFTLGGNVSVSAGPVGRSADAATNTQLNAEILAYSRAKGLFAGATLEGAAIHADDDAIEDFYGREYELEQVLRGDVTASAPAVVAAWQRTLAQAVGSPSRR
jgi:lipid-binding SYLF domain-containing protein